MFFVMTQLKQCGSNHDKIAIEEMRGRRGKGTGARLEVCEEIYEYTTATSVGDLRGKNWFIPLS